MMLLVFMFHADVASENGSLLPKAIRTWFIRFVTWVLHFHVWSSSYRMMVCCCVRRLYCSVRTMPDIAGRTPQVNCNKRRQLRMAEST